MTQINDELTGWFQATTLAERSVSLRGWEGEVEYDEELATRQLERWRADSSLSEEKLFAQRLSLANLTEDEFKTLLSEAPEVLQARFKEPPAWLTDLNEVLATQNDHATEVGLPFSSELEQGMAGFLELVQPLIRQARGRLRQGIARLSSSDDPATIPFDPTTIEELLLQGLAEHLLALVAPTLALELQVARFSGLLAGETPQARFLSFIELLQQPDRRTRLLREYSVLTRLVHTVLHNRVKFGLEFLEHLRQDWVALGQTFSPARPLGQVVRIETSRGDTHQGGRAVMFLTFSSGLKLVYKPRSLAVELHFQQLLGWLNGHSHQPPFRRLKILTDEAHGWVEFVEVMGCNSVEEVRRFYQRQGGYLAVLYTLNATDVHYENLLAAGEHPVLIDLETLFHPAIGTWEASGVETEDLTNSVLRVGLLPYRRWPENGSEGVEWSGLGGQEGQLSPLPMPTWERSGTDQLRRVYKRIPVAAANNQPNLNGSSVNPLEYLNEIIAGFSAIYRLLIARRAKLVSPGGPLRRFSQDPVRIILRSTHAYQMLQEHRLRPDRLRNALELDRFYDKLWVGVRQFPYLARVINAECQDLHQDDYPIFTTRPASTHLWTSTGSQLSDFLDESGLQEVERRIDQLDEYDLAKQIRFIRTALTDLNDKAPLLGL